ncbi:MAG: response regulator transcription factor [Actinobacteria bacterium]|nr:response regulator transcription factor [Actinomycetota bacterium]
MVVSTRVGVVLARFEDLVDRGLQVLIEEDEHLELRARGVPHERLVSAIAKHRPQVALLNYGSLRTPLEVRELVATHPDTHLVVLANRPSPAECNQMLAFGATACLSKETQARDVLSAIHLASRGLHVLRQTGTEGADDALPPSGPELLTPREAAVLELLQGGRSNGEIAAQLHIGVETVRTHARAIYRKLGVRSRRELART